MRYTLYRMSEATTTGMVEDESENTTYKHTLFLVSESEDDEFQEWMVGRYEDQDYSYTVNLTELATLSADEVAQLPNLLRDINEVEE